MRAPDERAAPSARRRTGRRLDALSDDALIAGMAARDEHAGLAFVRRHEARVFGIALAITSDRSSAEEVAQEAFLRAWRHAAVFDAGRGDASAWLASITRNLAIDVRRVRRAEPIGPDDSRWRLLGAVATTEEEAVRGTEDVRVRAALAGVPEEQRRCVVLSFFGYSASEIATGESIPLGTAKSRIRLGLDKLRVALAAGVER